MDSKGRAVTTIAIDAEALEKLRIAAWRERRNLRSYIQIILEAHAATLKGEKR